MLQGGNVEHWHVSSMGAERQKSLFAYVLLGQLLPAPLASLERAAFCCSLAQSCLTLGKIVAFCTK